MQQRSGQLGEEQPAAMKETLVVKEERRDGTICDEMMKKAEDGAINGELTKAKSNGKVADVFSELTSAIESLSKSNKELKIKESAIESLKFELEKAEKLETELAEKNALLEKLKQELAIAQSSEARALARIRKLESKIKEGKESETEIMDSFAVQTKRFEEAKILLEESKLEVNALHDEVGKLGGSPDKTSNDGKKSVFQEDLESLKTELRLAKENLDRAREEGERVEMKMGGLKKEMELLKIELKRAIEAEENNKKAMDDLALALKEVVTESNERKEKLVEKQIELEHVRKESMEAKEKFRKSEIELKALLDEARKEADLHRNIADRLRIEADESIQAWNGKETGFVDCIRKAEEEKAATLEENSKLVEALTGAEEMNKTAKEENQKLRDILKQALDEANVAKEAAEIAKNENSQLQDLLAEKDDAFTFITRENENLRTNEARAAENIKELKRLVAESSGKEWKPEDKDNKLKTQNSGEHPKERKLSNAFSLNLKDLLIHSLHYTHDQDQKIPEKRNETEEDEDSESSDPLKGSIFDVDSPVAEKNATTNHHHHHRRKSSLFGGEDGEGAIHPDDLEHLDGEHIYDLENEKNPKKKRALLRRFGDIITRRRGGTHHRRESSMGGENLTKKDSPSVANEVHNKKEAASPMATAAPAGGDHNFKPESSEPATPGETHKKESFDEGSRTNRATANKKRNLRRMWLWKDCRCGQHLLVKPVLLPEVEVEVDPGQVISTVPNI